MIYFVGNKSLIEDSYINVATVEGVLDYFKNHEWIAVDTETKGLDPHSKKIISLQLGDSKNQFFIDVRYINILLFKELLETKKLIFQNAKFDYKFFYHIGIYLNTIYDTMLAECVLFCGYEKYGYGLFDLCNRYLGVNLDKSTRAEFSLMGDQPFTTKQIEYGALDVAYLHEIKEKQQALIDKWNLQYCIDLENEVVKAFGDIEYNGMYLDANEWLTNTTDTKGELKELENKLDSIILNDPILCPLYKPRYKQTNLFDFEEPILNINYSSPAQILKIFKALGINDITSTGDRELKKLENKHEFFKVLSEHRGLSKIISTYGESFIRYVNKYTERVHTSFWQIVSTGRCSSGSKFDNAPNLQNIPADNRFRNCFKARKGFKWVSTDYSGQELRLMADASDEEGFINVLNSGEDLHCYVGSMLTGRTITKKDKKERSQAKNINFMKPYGGGPPKLADMANIPLEEAEEIFSKYAKAFPKLNNYLVNQGVLAKQRGYSETSYPCIRKRFYPDMEIAKELRLQVKEVQRGSEESRNLWSQIFKIEGQTERNGGNAPIQGGGANITKEALIGVRNLILSFNRKYKDKVAYLICTVHDAIDVEVREDLAEKFARIMERIMIQCGNKYVSKVKMEVDTTITEVWQK